MNLALRMIISKWNHFLKEVKGRVSRVAPSDTKRDKPIPLSQNKWGSALIRRRQFIERAVGASITIGLLIILFLLASWSDVSSSEYKSKIISFTNVVASPSVLSIVEAPSTPEAVPAPTVLPKKAKITLTPTTRRSPPKLNATEVQARAQISRSLRAPTLSTPTARVRTQVPETGGVRRRVPSGLSSQALLPSAHPSVIAPPSRRVAEVDVAEEEKPEVREEVEAPEIRVYDESSLSAESEETKEIVEWISQHQTDVPLVVCAHMNYEEGDKASGVYITIDGRKVEIFLLSRAGYEQLHILLVDGENSYLFINRGMSDNASRFRIGEVNRTNNVITAIDSQEREITSDESQMFYSAFMDWWETTKIKP